MLHELMSHISIDRFDGGPPPPVQTGAETHSIRLTPSQHLMYSSQYVSRQWWTLSGNFALSVGVGIEANTLQNRDGMVCLVNPLNSHIEMY